MHGPGTLELPCVCQMVLQMGTHGDAKGAPECRTELVMHQLYCKLGIRICYLLNFFPAFCRVLVYDASCFAVLLKLEIVAARGAPKNFL